MSRDAPDTVLLVVHSARSQPGQVAEALHAKGWKTRRCCPREGDPLPDDPRALAGAVVFGGPMSANDDATLPFIRDELAWIEKALNVGAPFLGICLGAQMLARVLGGRVAPHPEGMAEIGYYSITPTPAGRALFPEPIRVYHWHREGFTLPPGAELLATGEIFENQAFRVDDRAYGLQFHPEMRTDILRRWMEVAGHKMGAPGARPKDEQIPAHERYGPAMHAWFDRFVDRWLGSRASAEPSTPTRLAGC